MCLHHSGTLDFYQKALNWLYHLSHKCYLYQEICTVSYLTRRIYCSFIFLPSFLTSKDLMALCTLHVLLSCTLGNFTVSTYLALREFVYKLILVYYNTLGTTLMYANDFCLTLYVLLIDFSTFWCLDCQQLFIFWQHLFANFSVQYIIVESLLSEGAVQFVIWTRFFLQFTYLIVGR